MKIIYRGRRGGKTTELINLCAAKGKYKLIVCSTIEEAGRIMQEAKRLNLYIPMPITYYEFINKRYYGKNIESFLFDNVDLFLQYLTTVHIEVITLTKEE